MNVPRSYPTVLLWLLAAHVCAAASSPIDGLTLAKLLLVPGPWSAQDRTAEMQSRTEPKRPRGGILIAHEYLMGESPTVSVSITVGTAGSLWDQPTQDGYEAYGQAAAELLSRTRKEGRPEALAQLEAMSRQRLSYGATGFGWAGPEFEGPGGGGIHSANAHFPGLDRDVSITLVYSARAYEALPPDNQKLLSALEAGFKERGVACLDLVVSQLAGKPMKAEPLAWEALGKPNEAAKQQHNDAKKTSATNASATGFTKSATSPTGPGSAPAAPPAQPSADNSWLRALGLASLAVIAWVFWRVRGR